MPRIARTLDLLAELEREEAPQRQGHLSRKHGRAALNEARAAGAVHALLPRIFAHHRNAEAFTTRAHAAMEWLPGTVALTGLAACAVHGLLEVEPQQLRAAAPSPLHVRSPRWLTLRRCTRPTMTTEINGIRVATVAHAIIHAWEEDPTGGAREAIFAALREGKTTVASIRDALSHYPRVKGRRRFLAFLAHLHNGMHSWLEYVGARTVLNTPDLSCFTYQRRFVLEGHVFFADRYDPNSRTLVEFDSARFHGEPEQRAYDAWRDELFRRAGYDTVRLPYPDVIHKPKACRAKVRAKVVERLAGAPPPSPA